MLEFGYFPLREGIMIGFEDDRDSQGILLSWGMWEVPEAANDNNMDEGPELA